jgi:hypothetical protein
VAGLLRFFKPKKEGGEPTAQTAEDARPKLSLFGRKAAKAASGDTAPNGAETPKERLKPSPKRKTGKTRPPIEPKLPEITGEPGIVYELDSDSLLSGGRRKMALGLLWQPREAGQRLDVQAKAASLGDNAFDLSVLHANGTQVGFASKLDAQKVGMVAAATAFPRAYTGDTWLAAFVLPISGEQMQVAWWIVAVRDGLIYEDRLVRNEIDARDSFVDLHDAPGWQVVICPSNWQIDNAADVPLGLMLPGNAKGSVLKSHSPVLIWAPRAIAAGVLIGGLSGAYFYWQSMLEAQRQAEAELLASQERARLAAQQVPPWSGLPGLDSFAKSCAVLISEALVQPPGWDLQPLECTVAPGQITVSAKWIRQSGGRLVWLYGTLRDSGMPAPQLDEALANASLSLSASIAENDWKDVSPLDPALMVNLLAHRFDTLSLPLSLAGQPPEPLPFDAANPNAVKWGYHLLEMTSSTFLATQIQLLADIPAVVPQSVSYDPSREVWSLRARIYHPPLRTS